MLLTHPTLPASRPSSLPFSWTLAPLLPFVRPLLWQLDGRDLSGARELAVFLCT